MKKRIVSFISIICLMITCITMLTACGGEELNKFSGITFSDKTVNYNGQEHEIVISGNVPQGAKVEYDNNTATNAGKYAATASISMEGYETLNLKATLKINKIDYDMSNANWDYSNPFLYDGQEKQVLVTGLPQGVSVKEYHNNKKTNIGTYIASVDFNYDTVNYNIPEFSDLTWNIVDNESGSTEQPGKLKNFEGLSFNGEIFYYDETEKHIEVVGVLPEGTSITYTCEEDNNIENKATGVGRYTIKATITNPNYNTLELTAVMIIKGEEQERHIVALNSGEIYFANALDNDYLYKYDGENVERISFDVPYNFVKLGNKIVFNSKSLLDNSIKELSDDSISSLHVAKAENLVTDGTYLYYSVNALTNNKSGIYKLDISGDKPIETKIMEGKSKYLNYYEGFLYFADGTNDYKLTKYSISNNQKILLRDEKITALIAENGYLFYTVNNFFGDYIENYNLSNGIYKKLSIDAGANLTLIDDKLYYLNIDLATSFVFGDGIYYVDAYPSNDTNLPGTKLFDGNNKYSSLTKINDNELAYYIVDTQMLCIYDIEQQTIVEILDDFEIPEYTPLSTGSKTQIYDGKVYYLDLYKGKTLNMYDPEEETITKLTSNKVTDFTIVGDYLYYNSVNWLVDNNIYKINLKTGGMPEMVSEFDGVDIIVSEGNIFYVECNAAGVRTAIRQVSESGEDTIIYSKGANNLRLYDGYLYFEDGNNLYRMPTNDWIKDEPQKIKDNNVDIFEIYNGVIYFREKFTFDKKLSKINVDGTGYAVLSEDYDPVGLVIENDVIYFYSDTISSSTAGLFSINVDGSGLKKIISKNESGTTYYISSISFLNNEIYFVNHALGGVGGDSHLYKVNVSTSLVEKVS